jgi:hypothetical protein
MTCLFFDQVNIYVNLCFCQYVGEMTSTDLSTAFVDNFALSEAENFIAEKACERPDRPLDSPPRSVFIAGRIAT